MRRPGTHGPAPLLMAALIVALALPCAAQRDADALQRKLDVANGMFLRGLFEDAAAEYEAYLALLGGQPAPPEVWYRLGEAAYAAGDYARALEAFEALQALPGDNPFKQRAQLSQGEVYYLTEAYARAIQVLEPIASGASDGESRGRALYFAGQAMFGQDNVADAIARFKMLVEDLPGHPLAPYAEFQLAYGYSARGDLENAAIHFSAVAGSKADDALRMESRFRAAQTYDQIGWYSAALGAYEQLRAEFPESPFREQAGAGHIWALYHEGKFDEAQSAIRDHLKQFPETAQRVELDYVAANCLQQTGDNGKALEAFEKLRAEHPESPFAVRSLYKIAWIHYLEKRYDQARERATAFLQGNPPADLSGEAAFLLGTIHVAQGSFTEAQREFRLVADQYPDSAFGAEALFKAGECLEALAMSGPAAETFDAFLDRYPEHALAPQALLRAGDTRFAAGDYETAAERFTRVLDRELDPALEEQARYRLALAWNNLERHADAVAAFATLVDRFPESAYREEALFRVAEYTLKVAGEPVEAVERYQALIDAAPEGPYADRALLGLALARYEHKDFDQAADLFLEIMRERPGVALNEEAYTWTGQWYFDNAEWKPAAEAFEALLAAAPAYPYADQVRLKIAECLEQSGAAADALAMYETVAEGSNTNSVSTEARWRMARIHEARGELDQALEWYEVAANSNTGEIAARARFQMGVLQEGQEAWDKAARSFMGVAILFLHESISPEALWRAGQCYEKAGQPDSARKAYAELRADFPESDFAAKAGEALSALGSP
ncbi:MAG: tetratricopeptide repeat protein [Candidatus Hydrogenedentes bacterium]|nr:tetratricopeptide repeat protein [Candidatus Hydrogenedentota bacterium]